MQLVYDTIQLTVSKQSLTHWRQYDDDDDNDDMLTMDQYDEVMTQFCQAKNMSPLKLNISSSFTLFCWCK
jgi:hypothetical protein